MRAPRLPVALVLAFALAALAAAPAPKPAAPTPAAPKPATPAPKSDPFLDLAAEDPHGRPLRFKDFAGKIRIIDLWATWCGPCRMTIPELNTLYDRHRAHGVVVIGISMDDDSAAVLEFQAQVPMRYPTAMFNPALAGLLGQPEAIPTTYLVDRMGRVKRRYVGYVDAATLEADLARLL